MLLYDITYMDDLQSQPIFITSNLLSDTSWIEQTIEVLIQVNTGIFQNNTTNYGDPVRNRTASCPGLESGAPPFMRLSHNLI